MNRDRKGQPYVEYKGRRITFIPKGRDGKTYKDWSDSAVIRIQAHQYDKENGNELPTLCQGAELPIGSIEEAGTILGLLAKVILEGFKEP